MPLGNNLIYTTTLSGFWGKSKQKTVFYFFLCFVPSIGWYVKIQIFFCKKEFECTKCKATFKFFFNIFGFFMPYWWQWQLAIYMLSVFPTIRNLSSLNDLYSLNDLSGLNGLNSLISSKHLLRMILPWTWQQNDPSWSLNVEWIVKNPLFYGFLALFQDWGCGGQGCYFQPNPSVISQMSASHECTDTVFITPKCIFLSVRLKLLLSVHYETPCSASTN